MFYDSYVCLCELINCSDLNRATVLNSSSPCTANVIFVVCYQIQLHGLTGPVKFDKYGLRTGFSLDVLEVSLGRGLAKVSGI